MYHMMVKRRVTSVFERLTAGDHEYALSGVGTTIVRDAFHRGVRWPWDTTVVAEWTDRATPLDGNKYVNSGSHVIRMQWGKVVSIHAYLEQRS